MRTNPCLTVALSLTAALVHPSAAMRTTLRPSSIPRLGSLAATPGGAGHFDPHLVHRHPEDTLSVMWAMGDSDMATTARGPSKQESSISEDHWIIRVVTFLASPGIMHPDDMMSNVLHTPQSVHADEHQHAHAPALDFGLIKAVDMDFQEGLLRNAVNAEFTANFLPTGDLLKESKIKFNSRNK